MRTMKRGAPIELLQKQNPSWTMSGCVSNFLHKGSLTHPPPVDNPLVSFVMMHAQSTESPAIFWRGVWDLASDLGEKSPVTEQPSFSFLGHQDVLHRDSHVPEARGGGMGSSSPVAAHSQGRVPFS